jgi:hypothetical protein
MPFLTWWYAELNRSLAPKGVTRSIGFWIWKSHIIETNTGFSYFYCLLAYANLSVLPNLSSKSYRKVIINYAYAKASSLHVTLPQGQTLFHFSHLTQTSQPVNQVIGSQNLHSLSPQVPPWHWYFPQSRIKSINSQTDRLDHYLAGTFWWISSKSHQVQFLKNCPDQKLAWKRKINSDSLNHVPQNLKCFPQSQSLTTVQPN